MALLVRRCREFFGAKQLQVVGTSATLAGPGTYDQQQAEVAEVAGVLFGAEVLPADVIGETLKRATPEEKPDDTMFLKALKARVENPIAASPGDYHSSSPTPCRPGSKGHLGFFATVRLTVSAGDGRGASPGAMARLQSLAARREYRKIEPNRRSRKHCWRPIPVNETPSRDSRPSPFAFISSSAAVTQFTHPLSRRTKDT